MATCLAGLSALAACAGQNPSTTAPMATTADPAALSAVQQAEVLKAQAKAHYAAPGPASDPWGPYIAEASTRFDVPQRWIREVMHVESNATQFRANGTLTTSPVGAMGLMQLMPATYREVEARYHLGEDPFEPHDNIMAGTAYLREMYDAFGTPAFLAAYNAGPNRLASYLANQRPLPDETRRYVAMIGSRIGGVWPQSRSPAEQVALNQIPVEVPAGMRWGRHRSTTQYASRGASHGASVRVAQVRVASVASRVSAHPAASSGAVEVAEAPEPRAAAPKGSHGLTLISPAMASENVAISGRDWAVQIGAYGDAKQAKAAASASAASFVASHVSATVAPVKSGHSMLYRARLSGMTHDAAVHACQHLAHKGGGCLIVSPASQ